MTRRWTASFAYNLFDAIDWAAVAQLRHVYEVERR